MSGLGGRAPAKETQTEADDAQPFWRRKRLAEMSRAEWESLCDGCGKCCLHKIAEDDGSISYTDIACRLLDIDACRCTRYARRNRYVPDCVRLTPDNVGTLSWMPSTCAYRLLAEGKDLPKWHPLVTGDPESTHRAQQSVRGRAVPQDTVDDLTERIVKWPE
ncbi:MAG: YcgN family cysteine cluster protein [Proteobacteria bacterium]|nr:YcgN family cysteine cluster protein [Pseudomonadota bacterium]